MTLLLIIAHLVYVYVGQKIGPPMAAMWQQPTDVTATTKTRIHRRGRAVVGVHLLLIIGDLHRIRHLP